MSDFTKRQEQRQADYIAKGGKCRFCCQVVTLSKKRQRDLYDALLDRNIHHATIVDVLADWGVTTSKTSIQNHRTGTEGYALHMDMLRKAAGL